MLNSSEEAKLENKKYKRRSAFAGAQLAEAHKLLERRVTAALAHSSTLSPQHTSDKNAKPKSGLWSLRRVFKTQYLLWGHSKRNKSTKKRPCVQSARRTELYLSLSSISLSLSLGVINRKVYVPTTTAVPQG